MHPCSIRSRVCLRLRRWGDEALEDGASFHASWGNLGKFKARLGACALVLIREFR